MATLAATEPVICPNALPAAESVVPTCMFAPDRGCDDDPCGADGFEDWDGTNGDPADHLDLSSKVGLTATGSCHASTLASFPLELYVLRRLQGFSVCKCYSSASCGILKVRFYFVLVVQNSAQRQVCHCPAGKSAQHMHVHTLQELSVASSNITASLSLYGHRSTKMLDVFAGDCLCILCLSLFSCFWLVLQQNSMIYYYGI